MGADLPGDHRLVHVDGVLLADPVLEVVAAGGHRRLGAERVLGGRLVVRERQGAVAGAHRAAEHAGEAQLIGDGHRGDRRGGGGRRPLSAARRDARDHRGEQGLRGADPPRAHGHVGPEA